jgi:hypothetical protein
MIVSLKEHIHYQKQLNDIRQLDVVASITALDECIKILNINELPELNTIKSQIQATIKKLEKLHEKM